MAQVTFFPQYASGVRRDALLRDVTSVPFRAEKYQPLLEKFNFRDFKGMTSFSIELQFEQLESK
jgi:hypothetical protein